MFGVSRRELAGLVALFLMTLPAVTPRLYSSDEVQYFSYLRSLWFDHDVSFENEYRYFYDRGVARTPGFEETFLQLTTPAGRRVNFATLGCALLWSPFYAVADAASRVAQAAGAGVTADGFSQPYIGAVAYGSAFYGFVAILLSIGAARRLTGYGIGQALVVWAGTPLLFYMYAAPPYSHACSAFAVALFVTVWLHVRRDWSPRGMAALGAAAALMAMVREQDIFFALGPAVDFMAHKGRETGGRRQDTGDSWGRLVAAGAGFAAFTLVFLPQLLAYRALNGQPTPSRLVARKMTWTAPHALDVLLSPEHGFFFWTPLAPLAIVGLVMLAWRPRPARGDAVKPSVQGGVPAARSLRGGVPVREWGPENPEESRVPGKPEARRIGACALLMVAVQVYVSGSVESWTVAGAFGQRRFVALTILLVLGVATLWRMVATAPAAARYAVSGYAALAIWWNVALMAAFGTGLMDRQRLELRRNAYDAFVTLPRMAPEIAYRYFARRESFYKTSAPEAR